MHRIHLGLELYLKPLFPFDDSLLFSGNSCKQNLPILHIIQTLSISFAKESEILDLQFHDWLVVDVENT